MFSISFLFIDRSITKDSIGYKFDIRDRCTYWCWLDHITSRICYSIYFIISVIILVLVIITNKYINKSLLQLKEQFNFLTGENNDTEELIGNEKNFNKSEVKKSINEIIKMRKKCLLYACVTLIIWFFLTLYRELDDFILIGIDSDNNRKEGSIEEKEIFDNHPGLRVTLEIILVFYTVLASLRGFFYVLSFIIFEEKVLFQCFRKCIYKCLFDSEDNDEDKEEMNSSPRISEDGLEPIIRVSNTTEYI